MIMKNFQFFFDKVQPSAQAFLYILALAITLSFSACGGGKAAENKDLGEDYFINHCQKPPFEISTHMGEADDVQKAISLYNEAKYAEVVTLLETIKSPLPANVQLMLGNAYIQLKQYEKALPLLKKAAEDPNFINEATSYIIVCHVMLKQGQLAKVELEKFNKLSGLTPKEQEWAASVTAYFDGKR